MAKAQNIVTSVTVEIDAPVAVVWQVLTDLDRYAEWNPFTVRIDTTFKLGDPVHLHIPTPGKTSLIVIQRFGATMMMDNIGRIGYALFKTNEDIKTWPKYAEVKETNIEGKTLYTRVPKKYIIDAVETQPNTADRRIPKKLSPELDAGFGFVPLGSYSSQALIRKVREVVDGRRILEDTNNSSNDFEWLMPALPGGFKD